MNLGGMIRSRRKKLAMNGSQLAKKLGVSRQFVSQVELGLCLLTSSNQMVKQLAKVLKLDANKLRIARPRRRICWRRRANPFSNFLTKRRVELLLTQAEVAERAGRSKAAVARLELGTYHPSRLMLKQIEKALGCKIPIHFSHVRPRSRLK